MKMADDETLNQPLILLHGEKHCDAGAHCTNKAQQPGQGFKLANTLTTAAFCLKKLPRNSGKAPATTIHYA